MVNRMICLFGILFLVNTILCFPSGNSKIDLFSCHWLYLTRSDDSNQPTFEIRKPWFPTLNTNLNKGNENLQIHRISSSIFTIPGNNYDKTVNEHKVFSQILNSENPHHDGISNKSMNKNTENLRSFRILPSTFRTTGKSYEKSVNEQKASSQNLYSKKPSSDAFLKTKNLNVINTETPIDTDDITTTTEDQEDTTEESLFRISELSPAVIASLLGG